VDRRFGLDSLHSRKLKKGFLSCPGYSPVALPNEIDFPYPTPEDVFVKQADIKNSLIPQKKLRKDKTT